VKDARKRRGEPHRSAGKEETFGVTPVFARFREILAQQMGVPMEQVTANTSFVKDLGFDTLAAAELALVVEKEWNLEIDEATLMSTKTVGDAVRLIEQICM